MADPANPNNLDFTEPEPPALPGKMPRGLLSQKAEYILFYTLSFISLSLEICTAALGSHYGGSSNPFIGTVTAFWCLHAAAFLMTVWAMATAARRSVDDRVCYLKLAMRLQRLLGVCVPPGRTASLCHSRLLTFFSPACGHNWSRDLGGGVPLQRRSFQPGILDYILGHLDHQHGHLPHECVQQHQLGERCLG